MTLGYLWREHASDDGVTELRLHGVGGTTPESMLFDDRPIQVAGDGLAGFYRTDDCNGRHVEAYSWGGLTSRSGTRALWLLLFPFTLANVAGWAQAHPKNSDYGDKDPRRTVQGRLLQVLALLLTVQVIAGVAVLVMDLVAYQCGGRADCVEDRWWTWPFKQGSLPTHPGQRIAVAAALPVALLGLFLFLGRRSAKRYESKHPPVTDVATGPLLLRPSTWDKQDEIRAVRWAHVAAGIATVAGLLALATAAFANDVDENPAFAQLIALLAFLALLAAAASLVARGQRSGVVLVLALIALAGAVLAALNLPEHVFGGQVEPLRGIARASEAIFTMQILLLLITAGVALARRIEARRNNEPWPRAFRWGAPVVLSGIAVLITGAFFGGAMLRVADTLGTPAEKSGMDAAALSFPPVYDWVSVLFLVTLVALVADALVVMYVVWKRQRKADARDVEKEYGTTENQDCITAIAKARRMTKGIKDLDLHATAIVAFVFLVSIAAALARLDGFSIRAFGALPDRLSLLRTASSWVTTLLPVGAVTLVANGYRSPDRRRTIGIIWDLGTFWPRWFHPLAPPCYAERAIPDLQCRLLQLTERGRVILSAHSQGTIWATVALNSLPADRMQRIAYLTYGSPLSYLYPALFPDHFPAAQKGLAGKLFPAFPITGGTGPRRWRNLWRRTDPIGGAVSDGERDLDDREPLADPAAVRLTTCGACRPIAGHSHYLEDQTLVEYTEAVADALKADLTGGSPAPSVADTGGKVERRDRSK